MTKLQQLLCSAASIWPTFILLSELGHCKYFMPLLCISINLQSFNSWNLSFVGQISGRGKSSQGLKFRTEICDALRREGRLECIRRITLVTTSATPLHASYFECSAWHASCENAHNSSVYKLQQNPQFQKNNSLKIYFFGSVTCISLILQEKFVCQKHVSLV